MVTGVTASNMTANVLGTAVVPAQLKETPLKSDRRVSVFSTSSPKRNRKTRFPKTGLCWIKIKAENSLN